jgi:hypothetical protein
MNEEKRNKIETFIILCLTTLYGVLTWHILEDVISNTMVFFFIFILYLVLGMLGITLLVVIISFEIEQRQLRKFFEERICNAFGVDKDEIRVK